MQNTIWEHIHDESNLNKKLGESVFNCSDHTRIKIALVILNSLCKHLKRHLLATVRNYFY